MSPKKPTRYRIGYALLPKKIHTFIQPSLLNHATQSGIDLIPIEPNKLKLGQPPFDCILHKLSDPDWTHHLRQFITRHPNVVVIDHPDSIASLHSRVTMLEAIRRLTITHESSLQTPRQVFVESPDSGIDAGALVFPAIAKPVVADGSSGSHQMYLVLDNEGLIELKQMITTPFVLQEFVNHGGVMFKVYVAGRHVRCVKRRSLPDVVTHVGSEKLVPFSRISNAGDEAMEAVELPPSGFVNEVAVQLRRELRLNLFNFDMIRDNRDGGRYLVIDINYFPGYAKMPGYETVMTDFLLDVVQRKESVVSDECETV